MLHGFLLLFMTGCSSDKEVIARHPPVQLRLLTRREYTSTSYDLLALQSDTPASCSTDSDCIIASQSCIDQQCISDTCATYTFTWDGDSSAEVLVSGDFNGWATTLEEGGWKLNTGAGIQYLKAELSNGSHEYAFIVNGSQESTQETTTSCSNDGRYTYDPAALFPTESQPKHYFFDNNASKGLVSTTHIDKYIEAAHNLTKDAPISTFVSCDITSQDCISSWIDDFGTHTFRRPLSTAEKNRYQDIFSSATNEEQGVRDVALSLLTSPHFLYKKEIGVQGDEGIHTLDSYEIATAMSYFLWGSTPDTELLEAAHNDTLQSADIRREQALRMLELGKGKMHFSNILAQWLGTTNLRSIDKNAFAYYNFTPQTAIGFDQEQQSLIQNLVFAQDGSYNDLFLSNQSYLNNITASIYDITSVYGPTIQETALPSLRSAGVLSMGAFLSSHAHSDQSSPIKRGVAIRERILCQKLGEPPPNAGMAPEVDFNSSTQERFAQHTADPACASCHQYIDPIGLAMERFDGIGQYREEENGVSINPTGDLVDVEGLGTGTSNSFVTLPQLSTIIVESDQGAKCFVKQMYRFAFGGLETQEEEINIDEFVVQFESQSRNIQSLLVDIVASQTFITRELR